MPPSDLSTIRNYWDQDPCGTRYGGADPSTFYANLRDTRYQLEPWIPGFQDARSASGERVLEIGVGLGSDFLAWSEAGARAVGIDLSRSSLTGTRDHLSGCGHLARLAQADAEHLPFADNAFDRVYSYGVLHHSPHPSHALAEAARVLRPGGRLDLMLYHVPCWTGFLLWLFHEARKGRIFVTPREAIRRHLESPGTEAYTIREIRSRLTDLGCPPTDIRVHLGPGDLLTLTPSAKYPQAWLPRLLRWYPRGLIRRLGGAWGIIMLIHTRKTE